MRCTGHMDVDCAVAAGQRGQRGEATRGERRRSCIKSGVAGARPRRGAATRRCRLARPSSRSDAAHLRLQGPGAAGGAAARLAPTFRRGQRSGDDLVSGAKMVFQRRGPNIVVESSSILVARPATGERPAGRKQAPSVVCRPARSQPPPGPQRHRRHAVPGAWHTSGASGGRAARPCGGPAPCSGATRAVSVRATRPLSLPPPLRCRPPAPRCAATSALTHTPPHRPAPRAARARRAPPRRPRLLTRPQRCPTRPWTPANSSACCASWGATGRPRTRALLYALASSARRRCG